MRTFNWLFLLFLFHGLAGLLAEVIPASSPIQAQMKADLGDYSTDPEIDTILCPGSMTIRIEPAEICNGKVDCPGATDEKGCSCRARIDPSKLCDDVFDCPSIEDELGCPGCAEKQLKCDKSRTKSLCISLQQRCDGVTDCLNGMDEAACTVLSLNQNPINISVPHFNSGYVMRNVKSVWYPLCSPIETQLNSSSLMELAVNICQLTVGSASRNIRITHPKIDKVAYSGKFAVMTGVQNKPFNLVENCPKPELVSVKCPQPSCGKKAPTLQDATLQKATAKSATFNNPVSDSIRRSSRALIDDSSVQSKRIVGGRTSSQGAWPWMVQIIRNGQAFCGATLLTSRWILSAGHCFHSFKDQYYEVQLGMLRHSSFSPFEQTRTVAAVFVHPHYDPISLHNDLTLLLVQEPFELNQWSAPICLPAPKFNPPLGTNCTIVGWGYTAENGVESDYLREITLPLATCTMKTKVSLDSILCAGIPKKGGKDSCQGDSGGPMVCQDPSNSKQWILAGVVSFGVGCGRPGQVGAYTRVTYHLEWIYQTMKTTKLPKIVPKQICDGMICRLGTGACLDQNSICDDRVDCLNAEDEMDCPRTTLG